MSSYPGDERWAMEQPGTRAEKPAPVEPVAPVCPTWRCGGCGHGPHGGVCFGGSGDVCRCEGQPENDVVCEHGTAADVHCCNCHGGFLFDTASCVCQFDTPTSRLTEREWERFVDLETNTPGQLSSEDEEWLLGLVRRAYTVPSPEPSPASPEERPSSCRTCGHSYHGSLKCLAPECQCALVAELKQGKIPATGWASDRPARPTWRREALQRLRAWISAHTDPQGCEFIHHEATSCGCPQCDLDRLLWDSPVQADLLADAPHDRIAQHANLEPPPDPIDPTLGPELGLGHSGRCYSPRKGKADPAPAAAPVGEVSQGPPPKSIEETREWNRVWKAGYDAANRDAGHPTLTEVRQQLAALQAEHARLAQELAEAKQGWESAEKEAAHQMRMVAKREQERDELRAALAEQVQTTARIASERACLEVDLHKERAALASRALPSPEKIAELLAFIFACVGTVGSIGSVTEVQDAIVREWNNTFGQQAHAAPATTEEP